MQHELKLLTKIIKTGCHIVLKKFRRKSVPQFTAEGWLENAEMSLNVPLHPRLFGFTWISYSHSHID